MSPSNHPPISLYSAHGHRKYVNGDERRRFLAVAAVLPRRELATLCMVLAHTGCRISEALALTHATIASGDGVVAIRCLKKRGNQLVYRELPLPPDVVESLRAVDRACRSGAGHQCAACARLRLRRSNG